MIIYMIYLVVPVAHEESKHDSLHWHFRPQNTLQSVAVIIALVFVKNRRSSARKHLFLLVQGRCRGFEEKSVDGIFDENQKRKVRATT